MNAKMLQVFPLLCATAVSLALFGCGRGSDPFPARAQAAALGARGFTAIPVQAVTVRVGTLTAEGTTAGTIVPVLQSQVAAQVAGVVAQIVRNSGDWVKAGQAVVQLDDTQLRLSVHNAEAALKSAQINLAIAQDTVSQSNPKLQLQVQAARSALAAAQKNYDAQQALFKLGGTSAAALDSADSQLQQAQANLQEAQIALEQNQKSGSQSLAQLALAVDQASNQLQSAQLALSNATVRAPFEGQVASVKVNPGEYVSQNTPVFLLVSAARQVSFAVPPPDAVSLAAGSMVQFTYGGRKNPLRISQAPSAPIDGLVPMVAVVQGSPSLPFGAVGTVSYSLSLARGALIPIAALSMSENRSVVYTIADGKAAVLPVTVLGETDITVAVAGLGEGTQVILNPPPGLLPGAAVQVAGAAPAPGGQGVPAAQTGGGAPAPLGDKQPPGASMMPSQKAAGSGPAGGRP
jgi:multidrug efflux pump subunit AcrA (membrane-fusion protein)